MLTADIAREFIELAPTATLAEVPRAGHMVAGDNNDAFTAAIRAWLDTSAPRTSPTRTRLTKTVVDRTRVEAFLRSRGAERLVHPGGSLYEHLCRVSMLLSDWGADETIQMVGLCHACYGTDGFDHAMINRADRQVLRGADRPHSGESLVYLYCSCDRAAAYALLANNRPVALRDRFTERLHTPSEQETRDFMEVTAANELDALAHNQALLAEHGADLLTLFTGARDHLSDRAWRACVDLLGAQGDHVVEVGS